MSLIYYFFQSQFSIVKWFIYDRLPFVGLFLGTEIRRNVDIIVKDVNNFYLRYLFFKCCVVTGWV